MNNKKAFASNTAEAFAFGTDAQLNDIERRLNIVHLIECLHYLFFTDKKNLVL